MEFSNKNGQSRWQNVANTIIETKSKILYLNFQSAPLKQRERHQSAVTTGLNLFIVRPGPVITGCSDRNRLFRTQRVSCGPHFGLSVFLTGLQMVIY